MVVCHRRSRGQCQPGQVPKRGQSFGPDSGRLIGPKSEMTVYHADIIFDPAAVFLQRYNNNYCTAVQPSKPCVAVEKTGENRVVVGHS